MRYYPILRGKQYELLALREMADLIGGTASQIIPIVEPVKEDLQRGLARALDQLESNGVNVGVVVNPLVGDLASGGELSDPIIALLEDRLQSRNTGSYWVLAVPERGLSQSAAHTYRARIPGSLGPFFLMQRPVASDDALDQIIRSSHGARIAMSAELRTGRFRRLTPNLEFITISDKFPNAKRNLDYVDSHPILFTDEHLYAESEGYAGFGDYLTIGHDYAEGGFLPRVVAIHWTYADQGTGEILLRHFTSGPSDHSRDIGGKFLRAAEDLIRFLDAEAIDTRAANMARAHLRQQQFPGLGTLKKWSIMNHLELVSGILH